MKPPIFIFGVPRSGTTLLRTILDSHSAIACGPETPWLGGHQPRSVMELWRFLRDDEQGYCASYGMERAVATEAARAMVSVLFNRYAAARGKPRWAEKTPDNILHIPFLLELFPEARVIVLRRNGLDVAHSTCAVAEHRRGISPFLEQHVGFGPGAPALDSNPLTALLRWRHWNSLIDRALLEREHLSVAYEGLVTEPQATMRRIMEFIDEPFEPGMLDYARFRHEFPGWEWGSADVRARPSINTASVNHARKTFTADQLALLEPIASPQTAPALEPARAASALPLAASYLSGLSAPLGLGLAGPEQAWLWLYGIARAPWTGQHLLCMSEPEEPLAWAAALLGARVTFVTKDPGPHLVLLPESLRVDVRWSPNPPAEPADAILVRAAAPALSDLTDSLAPGGMLAACLPGPLPPNLADRFDIVAHGRHDSPTGVVTTVLARKRA